MQLKPLGLKTDNVLTKSRKLETKSSWIIKFRSIFKFEKAKEPRLADFTFPLLFIYRSRCTCVLHLWHVFTACLTRLTVGRGPQTVGGPGSLNLLNLPLLRHCDQVEHVGMQKTLNMVGLSLKYQNRLQRQ